MALFGKQHTKLCLVIVLIVALLCLRFNHLDVPVDLVKRVFEPKVRLTHEPLDRVANNRPEMPLDLRKDKHPQNSRDQQHATQKSAKNDTMAGKLTNPVRVLVIVMTSRENLQKAAVVRDTWGRRCDKLIFFSYRKIHAFPTIGLNLTDGHDLAVAKIMTAFRYVFEYHFNDVDWFMKVDDETYVVMENLRYFLAGQNTSTPIYFGQHFKTIVRQGYYSGGGGYVLSKEALRRLCTKGRNPDVCSQEYGVEDIMLGHCMENLGVRTSNSTDAFGRSLFHSFNPEAHLNGIYPKWYYDYDSSGAKKGLEDISDYAITFHNISPQRILSIEYYTHHLQPLG